MFSTDQFSFSQIPTHVSIVQLSITVYRNTGNVFYFLYVGALSPSLSFLNVRALSLRLNTNLLDVALTTNWTFSCFWCCARMWRYMFVTGVALSVCTQPQGNLNSLLDRGGNRTSDLWFASPMLCQLSYCTMIFTWVHNARRQKQEFKESKISHTRTDLTL